MPSPDALIAPVVFDEYGRYYDLLYRDKDYQAESSYVTTLIRRDATACSVLELGSGTGRHAELLAQAGFQVIGIERSPQMVESAAQRARNSSGSEGSFRCIVGDVRNTKVSDTFDAVISLFHVVSYQTSDQDLDDTFRNANEHLKPGGSFVFDVWHAPAVLTLRPEVRVKRIETDDILLTRIAEPEVDTNVNCVRVHYTIFIEDRATGTISSLEETHTMRYFSPPEITWLAEKHGFTLVATEEWMTGQTPGPHTWGVVYVLRKDGGQ